jgi:hypothetical protein
MLIESDAKKPFDRWSGTYSSTVGVRMLLRRGWLVPLAVLAVSGVAAGIASARVPVYRSEAVVHVPSGAGPEGPGAAGEAKSLAVTYAALISGDDSVARLAARATGIGYADVFEHISVSNDRETAILRLGFEAKSAETAIVGARALQQAVSGRRPVARGIAPGSVQSLGAPIRAVDASTVKARAAIPVGAILGLALGIILMIAWERADPRVDDAATLRSEADCPAVELDGLSSGSLALILERWFDLAGNDPSTVALVPVHEKLQPRMTDLVERLAEAARHGQIDVAVSSAQFANRLEDAPALSLVPTSPPTLHGVDRVLADADCVVLVVRAGERIAVVRRACDSLRPMGLRADWALLTTSTSRLRAPSV